MKDFVFPLEKVLNYKNQVLESLQNELLMLQNELAETEKKLSEFNCRYNMTNNNLLEAYQSNITAKEITPYKLYLNEIDKMIKINEEKYALLSERILKKQNEIINAKIEVSTFEKLREKEIKQYNEDLKKENETYIEEFVNNNRVSS